MQSSRAPLYREHFSSRRGTHKWGAAIQGVGGSWGGTNKTTVTKGGAAAKHAYVSHAWLHWQPHAGGARPRVQRTVTSRQYDACERPLKPPDADLAFLMSLFRSVAPPEKTSPPPLWYFLKFSPLGMSSRAAPSTILVAGAALAGKALPANSLPPNMAATNLR